jgi:outer membrane receptor protein involved in Fe transport
MARRARPKVGRDIEGDYRMTSFSCAARARLLACAAVGLFHCSAPARAAANGPRDPVEPQSDPSDIIVSGERIATAHKAQSPALVDTVVYDDLETISADGNVAEQLRLLPGISTIDEGDAPRFITIRGISPDLNQTTIDGITLASIGNDGEGSRSVNLQIIPSELTQRMDVYKTFTAEQDGAAIGGEEPIDFVFHYGDYIYEGADRGPQPRRIGGKVMTPIRRHGPVEIQSITDYRQRYALYKSDADLQAAHAATPWFVSFDDHEVDNNWAGDHDQDGTPLDLFLMRRAMAMQAYYEHDAGLLRTYAAASPFDADVRTDADVPRGALRRPDAGLLPRHPAISFGPGL